MTDRPASLPLLPGLTLEQLVVSGIVARFFEPTVSGVDYVQAVNPSTGQPTLTPVPRAVESPLAMIARLLYDQHRQGILDALLDRLGLDTIAEAAARVVLADLRQQPGLWSGRQPPMAVLRDRVQALVADGLAADQLAKLRATDEPPLFLLM